MIHTEEGVAKVASDRAERPWAMRNLSFAFPLRAGDFWFSPHCLSFDTLSFVFITSPTIIPV